VTLTDYVSSYWEKEEAEKAAKRVYGARAVANDLQVKLAYLTRK
jgi:osmotically-inducible protein OsmY